MNALTNAYLTSAKDPALVVLLNDASQMSEPTIKVTNCQERNSGLPLEGREGYAYTIELTDQAGKKTVRELYMVCSEGYEPNYNFLHFVAVGAEGDNFYKTHRSKRWTKEEITPEIRDAVYLFDNPPKTKKKHDLNGDEARARLCLVGRSTTQCKPN